MPENWKTFTLGDLVTFQRGHDLPKTQMTIGKYPVAGSNGIIGFHDEFTTKAPSITIGRSGNIGNPHYYKTDFWAHNTTLYIKEFKGSHPKFVYYFLKTLDFKGHNSGSAVPSLNRNYIHPIEIKVPPIEEQRRIAEILSALDEKIELNLEMNRTLEKIAQATFKHWFVDFQFPGFDGELVDGLPKGWRKEKINNLAKSIQYGFTQSSSNDPTGYKFLRITDIQGGTVKWSQIPYCKTSENEFKKYKIVDHDIFIARTGASTGENVYVTDAPDAVFASYLIRVQFDNPHLALYVGKFLRRTEYFGYVASIMGGSAQPNANAQELTSIEITVPTNDILEKYFDVVNEMNKRKITNEQQNQTLTQIRNGLLPKLMSGKIRVAE